MKALRSLLFGSLFALALVANTASAADESPWKFEFHGFVTGSMFWQDQVFTGGAGQDNLLLAAAPINNAPCKLPNGVGCNAGTALKSGTFLGGDVRQSRWIFVMKGPKAFGADPLSYFEGDFLGASATQAAGGIENTQARLRAAYGELKWGTTQVQAGQWAAQYLLSNLSASVAHIANPITFGTGTIGGRTVGLRVLHTMPLGDMSVQVAGEVAASKYADPIRGATPATISLAWASGAPSVGGRAMVTGKSSGVSYNAFAAFQWETVDFKGFGEPAPLGVLLADGTRKKSMSPYAVSIGGNVGFMMLNLTGNFWTGTGAGVWAGALNQQGEIDGMGYWAQLGVQATKELSVYGLYGGGSADEKGVRNWTAVGAQRKENTLLGGILKYSDAGYTAALEYYQMETTWLTGTFAAHGANIKTTANQLILSGHYAF